MDVWWALPSLTRAHSSLRLDLLPPHSKVPGTARARQVQLALGSQDERGLSMTRTQIWLGVIGLLTILASAGYALAHVSSGDDAEVRIRTRRLDDGRTEFALQQRTDGEWGERVSSRLRFLSADPHEDVWLNSSRCRSRRLLLRSSGTSANSHTTTDCSLLRFSQQLHGGVLRTFSSLHSLFKRTQLKSMTMRF